MRILLTGITGNLGFEIAHSLQVRDIEVVPIVRDKESFKSSDLHTSNVIEADLINNEAPIKLEGVDCIVHSAGNVHFKNAADENSRMMSSIIKIAKDLDVPIYYVSTAFLWRPEVKSEDLRNAYEKDKYQSEILLQNSGVQHTIFRPSVLVGHSKSGQLRNWSGYYLLVNKFIESAISSKAKDRRIRFPALNGTSNMVPVDQAAEAISQVVADNLLGELIYLTNPEPPKAQWVLDTTLESFDIADRFEFLPTDFHNYEKLERTSEEEVLSIVGQHFNPYWALSYNFPESVCSENLITREYLEKTLDVFQGKNSIKIV